MPAKATPAQLFPGITVTATDVTIPLADLVGVTQAEANPTTGDGAIVVRGLIEAAYTQLQTIAAADRPARFTITKGGQSIAPGLNNTIRQPYTVTFDVTATTFEVASEA